MTTTTVASAAAPSKPPALCSQRWNLSILSFLCLLFLYVVRVNLSVAIICMVRTPDANGTSNLGINGSEQPPSSTGSVIVTHLTSPAADYVMNAGKVTEDGRGKDTSQSTLVTADDNEGDKENCVFETGDGVASLYDGEFDWDKGTQSRLLAMYFYGYIFMQIPGGWLAGRYGGRRVLGICQAVCALSTLAVPLAARANVYIVYFLRFTLGLAAGVTIPCIHSMMGRWAPTLERSKLVAFSFSGTAIGSVLTFPLSAVLCVSGFDNGWASIFYLSGAGNLLLVVVWFAVTADTAAKHKRISEAEKNYILSSIHETPETKENLPTPWLAILKSGPIWGCIAAHVLSNYTNYTLLTSLPMFMKEVLKFDIRRNGGLSALPYLCQAVSSVVVGQVADRLRERGVLTTKSTRKLFQVLSFVGSAVCTASAGFMTCTQRPLAVLLLCMCTFFLGLNRAGYIVNHIDLAPRHAGVLYGITNTVATVPGMIAPLIAGALTPNRTAEEWRHVFFVCSAMAVLGAILYGLLADGEQQSWAAPPAVELVIGKNKTGDDKQNLNHVPAASREAGVSAGVFTLENNQVVYPERLSVRI